MPRHLLQRATKGLFQTLGCQWCGDVLRDTANFQKIGTDLSLDGCEDRIYEPFAVFGFFSVLYDKAIRMLAITGNI